jgi:predicted DsbA family dithiol-disulfide isomerase
MTLSVHIWSDVVCPWCFVGKRRFERAALEFGEPVAITWHSFELDPGGGHLSQPGLSAPERLARKYGMPVERAVQMMEQMKGTGEPEGIRFNLVDGKTRSSFDAHRLLHYALEHKRQSALKERLLQAHFEETKDCSDPEVLVILADEVGLEPTETRAVLTSNRYADAVRRDEESARELGITGVPFYVIGQYGVSGAQPAATFQQLLDRAYVEQSPDSAEHLEGEICTPNGCN